MPRFPLQSPQGIPMNELAVEVALSGVDPEEHFVYLSPQSEVRDGPETMSDYLNSARRFFPMIASGVLLGTPTPDQSIAS